MTLVELLIVMTMTVVIAGALSVAFSAEVTLQRSQEAARAGGDRSDVVEQTITRLLAGARLSATTTTPPITYFQGLSDGGATEAGLGPDHLHHDRADGAAEVPGQRRRF